MSEKFLNCNILTPNGVVYEGKVTMVVVTGLGGEIGILPLHAPYIGTLATGYLRLKAQDNSEMVFAISNGYVEVFKDKVAIIVESAEQAHRIDIEKAKAAKEMAEKLLAKIDKNDLKAYESAQADLEKAINQIKVGDKHRH